MLVTLLAWATAVAWASAAPYSSYHNVTHHPPELRVDIDDDGAGAAAAAPAGVGGGLIGMQERVHAYGGEVRAGPGQPGGWNVSAGLRLDAGAGYCSQVADTARAGLRRRSV